MTERIFEAGNPPPEQLPGEHVRVYFRKEPLPVGVRPDPEQEFDAIDALEETLAEEGVIVYGLERPEGFMYWVDCPRDSLDDLKALLEEHGFWVTIESQRTLYLSTNGGVYGDPEIL